MLVVYNSYFYGTLGIPCRLEMIKFLMSFFDITIITNYPSFIKKAFPNSKILDMNIRKKTNIPVLSRLLYYKKISTIVNSNIADVVFLFENEAPSSIWSKYPVVLYVAQYGNRSSKKYFWIKKIIHSVFNFLEMKGMKKSKINFVVSKPIIEILHKKGIDNHQLLPHCINLKKYQIPYLAKEHAHLKKIKKNNFFIVSYTGSVTENRGFKLMLDSVMKAIHKDRKIFFVIAGANEKFSRKIKDYQKKYKLENNIYNYGIVDISLIPGILFYSDVCFSFLEDIPAYRMSPPQKVVEYFAAGKPVICNKIETHEWLVDHKKNGLILDYKSNDVSKAILRLKRNTNLLKEMSNNAGETALKYDINSVYRKLVKTINKNLDEH